MTVDRAVPHRVVSSDNASRARSDSCGGNWDWIHAKYLAADARVRSSLLTPSRLMRRIGVGPVFAVACVLGGALATAIGTRQTLWIAAAGGTLAVLWLVRSPLLGMRELPEAAEAEPAGEAAA